MRSICLGILFLIAIPMAFASIGNISYTYPSYGESFNISASIGSDTVLYYKPAIDGYYESRSFSGVLDLGPIISRDSVYQFYLEDDDGRHPSGSINLAFSGGNEAYRNLAVNTLDTEPLINWFCNLTAEDYGCGYENMQALRALSYYDAYFTTSNSSYADRGNRLLTSDYGAGTACNPALGDFDCGYTNLAFGIKVNGSMKQGLLILASWTGFQYTHNATIHELAVNFTNGKAAECNVWLNQFNCGRGDEQGAMMLGYWKAYEVTNNPVYLSKAVSLSDAGLGYSGSAYLLWGFWKAFQLTGNPVYMEKAADLSNAMIDDCVQSACSPKDNGLHVLAYIEGYLSTGEYAYAHAAENKLYSGASSTCSPMNATYLCDTPLEQSLQTLALFRSYQALPEKSYFFFPKVHGTAALETPLNISVRFHGNISEPKIFIRKFGEIAWNSYDVDRRTGMAMVDSLAFLSNGLYEYYFNATGARFPKNGSFRLSASSALQRFQDSANGMLSDPLYYCDPFGTNPLTNNFSCRLEHMQGNLMEGLALTGSAWGNDSVYNISLQMAASEIDTTNTPDRHQTCDHYNLDGNTRDFVCEYQNRFYPAEPRKEYGAVKQASLIRAYLTIFRLTERDEYLDLALKYMENHPDECDIWNLELDCGNAKNQALMAEAFLEGYEVTGDEKFLDMAEALSPVYNDNIPDHAMVLYRLHSLTGKIQYKDAADAIMPGLYSDCIDVPCSVDEHASQIYSFWNAFRYSGNSEIPTYAYLKTVSRPSGENVQDCDPNNPEEDNNCIWPDQQGRYLQAYYLAFETYALENYSFEMHLEPSALVVDYNSPVNVSCRINNTAEGPVTNFWVQLATNFDTLDTSHIGVATPDKKLVKIPFLSSNAEVVIDWTLNATYGGDNRIICSVEKFSDEVVVNATNIGDVYSMHFVNGSFQHYNMTFTQNYTLANDARFDIDQFNLTILLPNENVIISNVTIDSLTAVYDNGSIYLDAFKARSNITFVLTYTILNMTTQDILFNISSLFGADAAFMQSIRIYSFDIVLTKPLTIPFLKDYNVSINVTNIAASDIDDLEAVFIARPNGVLLSHDYSSLNLIQENDTSAKYSVVEKNQSFQMEWLIHAANLSDTNISLQLSAPMGVEYTIAEVVDVNEFAYDTQLDAPADFHDGTSFEGQLVFENLVDNELVNISVSLNCFSNATNSTCMIINLTLEELDNLTFAPISRTDPTALNSSQVNLTFSTNSSIRANITLLVANSPMAILNADINTIYGTNNSLARTILAYVPTVPTSSGGASSSKGGSASAGIAMMPAGSRPEHIIYDYHDYDLYDEIVGETWLHALTFFDYNRSVFNTTLTWNKTVELAGCINVERTIWEDATELDVNLSCMINASIAYIADRFSLSEDCTVATIENFSMVTDNVSGTWILSTINITSSAKFVYSKCSQYPQRPIVFVSERILVEDANDTMIENVTESVGNATINITVKPPKESILRSILDYFGQMRLGEKAYGLVPSFLKDSGREFQLNRNMLYLIALGLIILVFEVVKISYNLQDIVAFMRKLYNNRLHKVRTFRLSIFRNKVPKKDEGFKYGDISESPAISAAAAHSFFRRVYRWVYIYARKPAHWLMQENKFEHALYDAYVHIVHDANPEMIDESLERARLLASSDRQKSDYAKLLVLQQKMHRIHAQGPQAKTVKDKDMQVEKEIDFHDIAVNTYFKLRHMHEHPGDNQDESMLAETKELIKHLETAAKTAEHKAIARFISTYHRYIHNQRRSRS